MFEAIELFLGKNTWIRYLIYPAVIGLAILLAYLALEYYGSTKYNEGFSARDVSCVKEKAADNAQRKDQTIAKQTEWGQIDSAPAPSSITILNRMRAQDL